MKIDEVKEFSVWCVENNAIRNGKFSCTECNGSGKIYDPNDPRDPIEGNKLRRVITCTSCKGSGTGLIDEWLSLFKADKIAEKKKQIQEKRKSKLVKSALKKLTDEEIKALGL
jgi:hypothetical protein